MAFVDPTTPNLADFQTFCQDQGINTTVLPSSSDYFAWALDLAQDTVPYVTPVPPVIYVLAVYNFGLHWLITQAQDVTGLSITALAWSGGLVTATTATALGFAIGQTFQVCIVGAAPAGYTGAFLATTTGTDTFTYPLPTNPGAATAPGLFNLAFFAQLRQQFNLLGFVAGVVQSTGDQGTNTALVVPDFFKNLTFADLDLMKTPWGRNYLAYAQKAGPTVVGLS
jgi:hypothetical protein